MRYLSLFALLVLSQVTLAAENDALAEDSDQVETTRVDPEITQETEDEFTETDEETSVRFIPTEEISQDLGVSFPVDI